MLETDEKVILSIKEGKVIKVYYRGILIGKHVEGDTESLSKIVETALGVYITRIKGNVPELYNELNAAKQTKRRKFLGIF